MKNLESILDRLEQPIYSYHQQPSSSHTMMEGLKTDFWKFLEPDGRLWQVSVGVLVVVACWIADAVQRQRDRVRELDSWIAQALKERDDKQFQVFKEMRNVEAFSDMPLLSATETTQQMQANQLNMVDNLILLAHRCRRYGRVQDKVNAVTQELYDEAHTQAKTLQGTGHRGLLLYGVPISVKDCIAIKGTLSTGGLACRLKSPSVEDSLIVQVIKHAGAIPLVRGNTIQTMMLGESFNRIWGRSRNPWDLSRTPGGSSGGDAALVAMECVPLAIGSDVAGSLRIPAVFCGICGFKPTSTRLSGKGNMKPRKDDRNGVGIVIPSTVGPMARTVDDCALFMKAACVPETWQGDLNAPHMPFDSAIFEKKDEKLVIGYFETDEWFAPSVAARRAVQETIQNLTKAGHMCKPITLPTNGWFNYGLVVKINAAEGKMRSFREALEGEPLIAEFDTLQLATWMPDVLRWIARKVVDERKGYLLGCARRNGISVWATWQLLADVMEMRSKWSDMCVQQGLDAIIFPALPLPALPHGIPGKLTAAFSNMFIANLLQWPCGVVPVTTVRQDEQFYKEAPNDDYCQMAHQVMQNSAGLPMGVQVMTPMFQDEKCLRIMKEVETLAGFTAKPMAYQKEKAAKTVRV